MKRSTLFGACVALVFQPVAALADPSGVSVASTAFREGREALKVGKFAEACARFRASEDAEPSSGARLNLGDCALRRGEFVEAETLYRGAAFLAEGEKRAFAEQRANSARSMASTLRLRWASGGSAGATVEVDAKAVEVPADLLVNPGNHKVRTVLRVGTPITQDVDIASGGTALVQLSAPPPAPITPVPIASPQSRREEHASSRSPWAFVLFGVGAAAVGTGVVAGFVAKGARDDLAALCDGAIPCPRAIWTTDAARKNFDAARNWALVSTSCVVGGAIALVAGGTIWLVSAPSTSGATVSLAGHF